MTSSTVSLVGGVNLELSELIDKGSYVKKVEDKLSTQVVIGLVEEIIGGETKYLDLVRGYHMWSR